MRIFLYLSTVLKNIANNGINRSYTDMGKRYKAKGQRRGKWKQANSTYGSVSCNMQT